MDDKVIRRAMAGDAEAARDCTEDGYALPCPHCGRPFSIKGYSNHVSYSAKAVAGQVTGKSANADDERDCADLGDSQDDVGKLSGWVPCSERMPERDERVLIFCPAMAGTEAAIQITRGYQCVRKRSDVSHWCPLPKEPEEDA